MANPKIDMFEELFNTIREVDQDLVRDLLKTVLERLMSAEADSMCGASYGERSQERNNRRNGYRLRPWDSRVGSIDLAVPKLRQGSYFPDWLLDIHRRSERALVSVVAEAWVRGVSHRRMEGLVNALGIEHLSRTQVPKQGPKQGSKTLVVHPFGSEAFWKNPAPVRMHRVLFAMTVSIFTAVSISGNLFPKRPIQ